MDVCCGGNCFVFGAIDGLLAFLFECLSESLYTYLPSAITFCLACLACDGLFRWAWWYLASFAVFRFSF